MREPLTKLPDDACIIARPPYWMIHYSPSEKKIYLDSTDYNSGPLALTRDDLVWLQEVMENWIVEFKEQILSWLEENHEDDWIVQLEVRMARSGTRKGWKIKSIKLGDTVIPLDEPKENGPDKT
ncbi:MAG: hypothetical protein GX493_05145 [Firmicutes bacterium]|nr:hypothetical protein [Bacillota bacterium]